MAHRDYGHELWETLVDRVRQPDDLPVFSSKGWWTAQKLYFVCQYLEQVTRGMRKARSRFPSGLTYVDLFCGTGISEVPRDGGGVLRVPGSPLIAAGMPDPFDRLILVDKEPLHVRSAIQRIEKLGYPGHIHPIEGDCNESIEAIAKVVPEDSLNVAFVDPYSLDIHFDTIRRLATRRALDLIVLFSDRFDIGRNVHKYYYPDEQINKLDRFLGTQNWREELGKLEDQTGSLVRQLFAQYYLNMLRQIGYGFSDSWPLNGPNGPVFRLVFASKNELGLKYCSIARRRDLDGNRGLFGIS